MPTVEVFIRKMVMGPRLCKGQVFSQTGVPKNLANSHPQTVENILPPKKTSKCYSTYFVVLGSQNPRTTNRRKWGLEQIERSVQVKKHHSKKKTATLKLVSLLHNPPPPHPVFTTNPFPLPNPPGSTTINFPHLELHWPFRCTLGCWTGCFCYCHLSRFSFSSQRTENVCHKNHRNFGVFQSRVVCFKMSESYMGVSLNGGTPKTPQKDHF